MQVFISLIPRSGLVFSIGRSKRRCFCWKGRPGVLCWSKHLVLLGELTLKQKSRCFGSRKRTETLKSSIE